MMKSHRTSQHKALAKTLPLALLMASSIVGKATASELKPLLTQAQQSEIRTDAEKARDDNRKPLETLEFFGLQPDMKVLELVPGGGWYTKLLAPVLRDNGQLFVAIGTGRIEENLLDKPGFEKVSVVNVDGNLSRSEGRRTDGTHMSFDVDNLDMVLTFRNLHNFEEGGRRAINKASFDALKPGGLYGVVDHTRRHMEPENGENRRRMDPVRMIKEIESVGFEFVDFSEIHYRPSDALELELRHEAVAGKTDRFTLLFKKPN
ncbi:class I SAM-dependent methyltransferase [Aurantivibrio plasticivorans]